MVESSTKDVYDVVIVGAGMAGLACAYALRHSGARVALLERARVGHDGASSGGRSRMYREMYSDPFLCRMAQRANVLWSELERAAGRPLRDPHGLLFYGESWDEETIEGSIPGARRVMDAQGIPYEALTADDIAARWPMHPRGGDVGLFEPSAGSIRADEVLAFLARSARRAGFDLREGVAVERLEPGTGGCDVVTAGGDVLRGRRVVVCAGPWTNTLLEPIGCGLDLELWSMMWGHYAVDPALAATMPQWFCFRQPGPDPDDGGLYYGFPVVDDDGPARIKVGIDWCPPSMRVRSMVDFAWQPHAPLPDLLDRFLREQLDGVGECLDLQCSPYTMSPDVNFVLDEVTDDVVVFTGGSGQAFKFAPLIGELLATLARGDEPIGIDPWRATRPAMTARAELGVAGLNAAGE
ncbi:MAG: FAD-dependent oxidoreductase [Myxococcota bacterium]